MWSWVLALALGGPVDEAAERAWLLIENGRPVEAREAMKEMIPRNPDGQLVSVYLDASADMGIGVQGVAETRGLSVEFPWEDMAEPLAGLVADKRTLKDAHDLAVKLRETYPDRPDLLAPLWQDSGGGKLGRLRGQVLGDPQSTPEGKARLLKLRHLIHIPDGSTIASVEQTFELDAFGPVSTDVELHDHARALVEKGMAVADLDLRPMERRHAVERAHPMFLAAGTPQGAATVWEQLGADDAGAWGHRAEAYRLAGRASEAEAAVNSGYRALGRPMPDDVASSDRSRRATHAVDLLARASEVSLAKQEGAAAWCEAVAASALAGEVRGAELGPAAAETLVVTYRGRDKVEAAMALAEKAETTEERWRHVFGAWSAIAVGAQRLEEVGRNPEVYLSALSPVWKRSAMVFAKGGDRELALAFGTLALAAGEVDKDLHAHLATWHAELDGDRDHSFAVFHHAAAARGLGSDRAAMEALIETHHDGLGEALDIATVVGGAPPAPEAVAAAPTRRSVKVRGKTPSAPPKGGAVIGSPIPDFSVETAFGTLSKSNLSGRVVIFTFFVSDHAPSIEQLKEAGQVARRLRARGVDVVHVGISRDADRGLFDDLHRVGQRWGQLAWGPEVATAFGVPRQPTTWVVDRNGVARYFVDHRIEGSELEGQVRAVSIE